MSFLKNHAKKLAALCSLTCALLVFSIPSFRANAESSEEYLRIIAANTAAILDKVNTLPEYISQSITFILAWMAPDDSDTTANLQEGFTKLANEITKNKDTQNSLLPRLTNDYFGSYLSSKTLPYANDLTYQTLLGNFLFNPDPRKQQDKSVDPAYNYIKNATGTNLYHVIPGAPGFNWGAGSQASLKSYATYYNTISSVQTFNAYVLSQLYADSLNGHKQTEAQKNLITQASSSEWFAQIASEKIGVVLRQILMFESQNYVYLTRLYDLQQQTVTAQAMTNTLLILLNQQNEDILLKKATGSMPA